MNNDSFEYSEKGNEKQEKPEQVYYFSWTEILQKLLTTILVP